MGHHVAALVFEHVGTLDALEARLGFFVTERRGFLVKRFGSACVLGPASPGLGERAHPKHGLSIALRGGLREQGARGDIVLRTAAALRHHQTELKLRLGRIGLCRFRQQGSGLDRIRRCAAAGKRREVCDRARIAALGRPLEQFARLRFVLGDARPGAEHHAELDHGRRAAFVGRPAVGAGRFRHLPAGGVGATEFVKRPAR
jgi:hypothetical protein